MSDTASPTPTSAPRWEYQVLRFPVQSEVKFNPDEVKDNLNLWGAEGWELVSTETIEKFKGGTLYFIATLKRQVN